MHPEPKTTKDSEKAVHVSIMQQSIALRINQRHSPRKESTGKWKHAKTSSDINNDCATLPAEGDEHQGALKSDFQRNNEKWEEVQSTNPALPSHQWP